MPRVYFGRIPRPSTPVRCCSSATMTRWHGRVTTTRWAIEGGRVTNRFRAGDLTSAHGPLRPHLVESGRDVDEVGVEPIAGHRARVAHDGLRGLRCGRVRNLHRPAEVAAVAQIGARVPDIGVAAPELGSDGRLR